MEAYKLQLKFFAAPGSHSELHAFVPIFQGFIRDRKLGDEVLIDVADYSHVHHGPGIVLIGHEGDYYMDQGEGRLGLLYNRKRAAADSLESSVKAAFHRALVATRALEAEPSAELRFNTDEVRLTFNDRLYFVNGDQAFAELRPGLERALQTIYGGGFELMREGTAKERLQVRIKVANAPNVDALLARLA